jgi:hypothetical protein
VPAPILAVSCTTQYGPCSTSRFDMAREPSA